MKNQHHSNPYLGPAHEQSNVVAVLGISTLFLAVVVLFLSGTVHQFTDSFKRPEQTLSQYVPPRESRNEVSRRSKTMEFKNHAQVETSGETKGSYTRNEPSEGSRRKSNFINTPRGTQPSGLAFHKGFFYMSSYLRSPGIFKIRASDGAVIHRFTPPVPNFRGRYGGLAMNGSKLIHVQANNNHAGIFDRLNLNDPNSIVIDEKFRLRTKPDCSDLAIHDQTMWFVSAHHSTRTPAAPKIYVVDLARGRVLRTLPLPFAAKEQNHGLAYGNGFLYLSSGNTVVKLEPDTMKIVDRVRCKANRLESLAWDGNDVWAASFNGGMLRVQFDSSAQPASRLNRSPR